MDVHDIDPARRGGDAEVLREEVGRRAEVELPGPSSAYSVEDLPVLEARCEYRLRQGRWSDAAEDARRLADFEPTSLRHVQLAALLLRGGDPKAYQGLCNQALASFGRSEESVDAERVAKICGLAPGLELDPQALDALSNRGVADADSYHRPWSWLARGLVHLRAGRWKHARRDLDRCLELDMAPEGRAAVHAARAIVRHRLDEPDEARASLEEAGRLLGETFAQPDGEPQAAPPTQWHDWLIARLLVDEARATLPPDAKLTEPDPAGR